MKNIVVPVDFSTVSYTAARYAIDMAAVTKSSVMFVSVVEIANPSSQLKNWEKLQKQLEQDTTDRSAAFMDEMNKHSGNVNISYTTLLGSPVEDEILSFAKKNKADLIITGTKGASGVGSIVFGSTSAALVNKSTVPVLVVPHEVKFKQLKRVVLATNMLKLDKQVKVAVKLLKVFNPDINILHVSDSLKSQRDRTDLVGILSRMANYPKLSIEVVHKDDVDTGLYEHVKEKNPDMLIMFTHKLSLSERLFGQGHTREMAFHTPVPLLSFKNPK